MRRAVAPAPVVRITVDRVVVRGGASPSRAALTAAIEQAVRAEVAADPGRWTVPADGTATARVRQKAASGSGEAIAGALAAAVARGIGGST